MLLKEKMMQGQKICGVFLRIVRNPAAGYLVKNAGLDFFMLDCEHSDYSVESIHDIALTANALDVPVMIRVPNGTRDNISRALDCGASGIMVPMIKTPEQAEDLVRFSKYPPVGERGFTACSAHTDYAGGSHTEIMRQANSRVLSIAQIETRQAVERVDEIASVQGLDMLFIGPNDLSVSLGIPGDTTNPLEIEAIERVAAACKKHNKLFGMHSGEVLLKRFAPDLHMVMSQLDITILIEGFRSVRALGNRLA